MIERIFKNWKTTLLGLLIIISALGFVYLEKATLTEAGAFMAAGIALFFAKDSKIK